MSVTSRRRGLLTIRLTLATAVLATGGWVACGGSDAQDVVASDAGSGRDVSPPPVIPTATTTTPTPTDAGRDAGGRLRDAGPPVVLDAGDVDGGVPCFAAGLLEEEVNDTKETANLLNKIRCGLVRAGSDRSDIDVMKFSLTDASTGFFLQYEGDVKIVVETDGGGAVDITQPGAQLPRFYDQPYYATVTSPDGKSHLWRLVLFTDP